MFLRATVWDHVTVLWGRSSTASRLTDWLLREVVLDVDVYWRKLVMVSILTASNETSGLALGIGPGDTIRSQQPQLVGRVI
jgi:hypothetical protein